MTAALVRRAVLALASREGGPPGRLRALGLRLVLGILLRLVHLRALVALLDTGTPSREEAGEDSAARVRGLRGVRATCLHRALAGYALLRDRGEDVRLVIGVAREGGDRAAHAWLERDGSPIDEPQDPRDRYAVAFTHPSPAAEPPRELPMAALRANPDVLLTELQDGTGVLLHLGTKFYFALNRTGVAAWKLLAEGTVDGPDALAGALADRFAGATIDRVRPDVEALLGELRAEALVTGGEGA